MANKNKNGNDDGRKEGLSTESQYSAKKVIVNEDDVADSSGFVSLADILRGCQKEEDASGETPNDRRSSVDTQRADSFATLDDTKPRDALETGNSIRSFQRTNNSTPKQRKRGSSKLRKFLSSRVLAVSSLGRKTSEKGDSKDTKVKKVKKSKIKPNTIHNIEREKRGGEIHRHGNGAVVIRYETKDANRDPQPVSHFAITASRTRSLERPRSHDGKNGQPVESRHASTPTTPTKSKLQGWGQVFRRSFRGNEKTNGNTKMPISNVDSLSSTESELNSSEEEETSEEEDDDDIFWSSDGGQNKMVRGSVDNWAPVFRDLFPVHSVYACVCGVSDQVA